jgi:hypothetical protein
MSASFDLISGDLWVWILQAGLGALVLGVSMPFGRLLLQYRDDYQPIASLFNVENRVGFNTVYRVAIAPLCIVLLSIAFYWLQLPSLIEGLWTVAVWLAIWQLVLLLSIRRWALTNKLQFLILHAVSIAISYYLYTSLIVKGVDHLLPDEANLRTDLWILIVAFCYGVLRNKSFKPAVPSDRKMAYIAARARTFRKRFKRQLDAYSDILQDALVALMIYEDFNRPMLVRWIEDLTRAETRGILQTRNFESDSKSVQTVAEEMSRLWEVQPIQSGPDFYDRQGMESTFRRHNPEDHTYGEQVLKIFDQLREDRDERFRHLTADDGYVSHRGILSPFDDRSPGISNLSPALRDALRSAATSALLEDVSIVVTSGWRSGRYQQALFDQAVRDHGDESSALSFVATVDGSAHVTGDAVDIGFTDAIKWLSVHGADYGLHQPYGNEDWHFELSRGPEQIPPKSPDLD